MIPEPLTYREAMASQYADERRATDEETSNLTEHTCFDRVSRADTATHSRLVKAKWMFYVMYNSDRTLQRHTVRLAAKGFTQVPASDFYGTYSPGFSYASFPHRYDISGGERSRTGSVGFEEQASLSSRSMRAVLA